ncbi:hypothetical protein KGY73_02615 [bacterium]|nr:hypothetical protein [bacterium]
MRKVSWIFFFFILSFITGPSFLKAQEEDWKIKGRFQLGYRYVEVKGNTHKYYEDLNLRQGPRLLDLDFNLHSSEKFKKYFDFFNVYASKLGGDPFENYGVTIKKYGHFNFRYGHRKSTYFYKDTLLPENKSDFHLSTGGDFHTFNFRRFFDNFYFDVKPLNNVKFILSFNRQKKSGESTTTLDYSRDEFELKQPLHEIKNTYSAGVQINSQWMDLFMKGSYWDYENKSHLFLPGFSPGADAKNISHPTELLSYELRTPYQFSMPMLTAKINTNPLPQLQTTWNLVYSLMDMELDYEEEAQGTNFQGFSTRYEYTGTSQLKRQSLLIDLDLSYRASENLYLLGNYRSQSLNQEGDLSIDENSIHSWYDLSTSIFELGTQIIPFDNFQVSGGILFQSRESSYQIKEEQTRHTERTTFFINSSYHLSSIVNIKGKYEKGSFHQPYTLISPTDLDEFKLRMKFSPLKKMKLLLSFSHKDLTNQDSGGTLTSLSYGFDLNYQCLPNLSIDGGYSRQKFKTSVVNLVVYEAPAWAPLLGSEKSWNSTYQSSTNMFRGSLNYQAFKNLSLKGWVYHYKNSGTWKLDWTTFQVYAGYTFPNGYLLSFSYRWTAYNEAMFDFDDYSSHIFTVGFGYKF